MSENSTNKNAVTDAMWDDAPVDVTGEANFIWAIANKLRGPYLSNQYKNVIIPMVIIRRFECALKETKKAVIEKYEEDQDCPPQVLCDISGLQFYNTSKYDLAELINESENLAENFKNYIQGFSSNVTDILLAGGLNFFKEIDKMNGNNRLFSVVKAFSELDLDPKTIDSVKMGYIFEELIRKFSENAEAGDHYTGRDIIKLMVNILLAEGCDDIFKERKVVTILDQACGTGGMLSTAYNFIMRYNPTAIVQLFGQEINPESYSMCIAEMLIKGQDANNIRYQDTLKKDCFEDTKMRFVLENPPFGTAWGGKEAGDEGVEEAVRGEHAKGENGRWGAGLPEAGDAQMLFLQSAIDKMDNSVGRCAIIHNGSPLSGGITSSGESQIRRWLLENDLLEAIIALPTDLFYNTPIATYIWVLSKNKRKEREGKVQLIDASSIYHKLRKALGYKRNEIFPEDRVKITKLYAELAENEYCKIYKNEEFFYREYTVMQPLQRRYAITEEGIAAMRSNGIYKWYSEAKVAELERTGKRSANQQKSLENYWKKKPLYDTIVEALTAAISDKTYLSLSDFEPVLAEALKSVGVDKKLQGKIAHALSVMDKSAEIHRDKKGNIIYDKETKTSEFLKFDEDIKDYMKREVLPHIPDAQDFWEEDLSKEEPVIKTGATIPFSRYFYKYQPPAPSEELDAKFREKEKSVREHVARLFK